MKDMKYILEGNEKELGRVLREQRVRVGRGLIKITPISGTLVSQEYASKTIESKTEGLIASLAEKDEIITSLTSERDTLKARVAELEAGQTKSDDMLETDNTKVDMEDNKEVNIADSKNLPEDDSMFIDIDHVDLPVNANEKKTTKKK